MSGGASISVVVPCFDGAHHLAATLDSLSAQTRAVHEVIVVDDGSRDSSAEIAAGHELRPRVLRQPNRGVAFARNLGVAAATGTHVAFLDQDDLWAPTRHARLVRYLDAHPECDALVTGCVSFVHPEDVEALQLRGDLMHAHARQTRDPRELMTDWHSDAGDVPAVVRVIDRRQLLAGPPSVTASYVIQRELLQSAGGCVPFARSFDDFLLLLDVSLAADVWLVDEPSLLYRVHPGSTTFATDWSLPLLTGIAAVRHGGSVVPPGRGRDAALVPPIADERQFVLHRLLELAAAGRLLDALALTQLLASSRRERIQLLRLLGARYLKTRVRRR